MRLIAFYGKDAIRTGRIDGDEVVVGGRPARPERPPRRRIRGHGRLAARRAGGTRAARGPRVRADRPRPDQDRVRRAELPRARRRRRPRGAAAAAPLREVREHRRRRRRSGRPATRARTRSTSRSSSASSSAGGPAASAASAAMDPRRRATSSSTTSARATGRAPRRRSREGEKGDGQWLRAKGSDTFLPMGPVLVTADELDPAAGLRLRSWRIGARTAPST